MSVHEIVLDGLLAVALGVLALLVVRARGSRQRSRAHVEAERALREQLSAQADALDRLLAATTGLADELDEGRLLERIAEEALALVTADCGLVLERTGNRCTIVTSAPLGQAWRPAALDAVNAADLAAELATAYGGSVEVTPLARAVAASRRARRAPPERPPFSAVERAQLRVFAAASVRTAHNARLFTLAETLRVEAELRERERGRLSDRLLRVEEGERRRLALALHDGPQQSIAGIGLIVQAAHDAIRAGDVDEGLRLAAARARALPHGRRLAAHADVRARAHHAPRPRLHGGVLRARRAALGVAQGRDRGRRERGRRTRPAGAGLALPHRPGGDDERRQARRRHPHGRDRPHPREGRHRAHDRRRRARRRTRTSSCAAACTAASTRCASAPGASAAR